MTLTKSRLILLVLLAGAVLLGSNEFAGDSPRQDGMRKVTLSLRWTAEWRGQRVPIAFSWVAETGASLTDEVKYGGVWARTVYVRPGTSVVLASKTPRPVPMTCNIDQDLGPTITHTATGPDGIASCSTIIY